MIVRQASNLFILLLLVLTHAQFSRAQTVIHYPGTAGALSERWKWSKAEIKEKGLEQGCWVGYSIQVRMGERSFIGTYHSDRRRNRPTLEELLAGMKREVILDDHGLEGISSTEGMITLDDEEKEERKVVKEVGLLFHIGTKGLPDELKVSNLSLHVDLNGEPLLWLGISDPIESISFIESAYKDATSNELKKNLIMALGLHEGSEEAIEFLKNILQSSEHSDIREDAAFWLGQTNSDDARKILLTVAQTDRSEQVREKAIFSISQMESPASMEALIAIAKEADHRETRKNAIFWLGQKASEKTLGTLKELADGDKDSEVQKSAVFALTQLDDGKGVDALIAIAKNHTNPRIRKEAIFWLGQNDDPKALDALIEIVRR